jgi:hypothetical protein
MWVNDPAPAIAASTVTGSASAAEARRRAAGPYDDSGITDAAALAAGTAAYLDVAARRGGLTAVTTVGVVTACLAVTAGRL